MKKIVGVLALMLALLAVPVYAEDAECDYILSFEDVRLSETEIDDGYDIANFSEYGYYLDICGLFNGATSDVIYAELSDDGNVLWDVYGTVIWNPKGTSAYIQGSDLTEDFSTYLDGKIQWSRGLYSISATGGVSDGYSFILKYKSIRGVGYLDAWNLLKASGLDQTGRGKFQKLDKAKLLGLKAKSQRSHSGINPSALRP